MSKNLEHLAIQLQVKTGAYHIENIDSLAFGLAGKYKLITAQDKVIGLSSVKSSADLWNNFVDENLINFDDDFLKEEYEEIVLAQNVASLQDYLSASRVGRGAPKSRQQRVQLWEIFERFNKAKASQNLYYKEEIFNKVSSYLKEQGLSVFSHVIVDELQDFSNVELNFIRSLVVEGSNDLFLVGDPLQNIYNKKIVFSRAGINIRGQRSKRLRINYRTTEEIRRLAVSVIRGIDFDNFDGGTEETTGYLSLFHGVEPEYHIFKDKQEELDYVFEEIIELFNCGVHYNEIAIAARTRDSVKDFIDYLHLKGIPYVRRVLLNPNNQGVRLTTFHGMKGLEFKHVFLTDVNQRTLPDSANDDKKQEKSLFYVASSRAVQGLKITGTGSPSRLITSCRYFAT